MIVFSVEGGNITLKMFTDCGVPIGIAETALGFMLVINGLRMYDLGGEPDWNITVDGNKLEVHANMGGGDIHLEWRW